MKDINNQEIKLGQTIKRITEDGTKFVGRKYEVILYDFENSVPGGEDLCAHSKDQTISLLQNAPNSSKLYN